MRWRAHKSFSLPPNAAGARLSPIPLFPRSSSVIPAAPSRHSHSAILPQPLLSFPRPPLLSFPRLLAGIQSEQAFSRIQSGVISLWQGKHDL